MTQTLTPREWTAYNLSHEAGVQSPDNRESPGALWLLAVRDAAVSYYDEDPDERREADDDWTTLGLEWWHEDTHRLADESLPDATYARWQIFTDLCLWQDDDLAIVGDRDHLGAKISLTDQATGILYEVAHRLTWIILTELSNNDKRMI